MRKMLRRKILLLEKSPTGDPKKILFRKRKKTMVNVSVQLPTRWPASYRQPAQRKVELVVSEQATVKDVLAALRERFTTIQFCHDTVVSHGSFSGAVNDSEKMATESVQNGDIVTIT